MPVRSSGPKPPSLRSVLASYVERIRGDDSTCVEVELACEDHQGQEGLKDEHMKELAAALKNNHHTRSINAWGNYCITDEGAEALLKILTDNSVLDRINLDLTSVSDEARARLQKQLFERCIQAVSQENFDRQLIHTLDLSRRNLCDSDVELVAKILKDNPFVTSLALWGNPLVSDEGVRMLLQMLQTNASLVSVSLERTSTSAEMQRDIAARINQSRSHKALDHAIDPRISTINLANASLPDAVLIELVHKLRDNQTLTTLNLMGNEITEESMKEVAKGLEYVPYFTNLIIDTHHFSERNKQDVRTWKIDRMIQCMSINAETCTKVDFSSCPLRDSEFRSVLKTLQHNSTVISLNLGESSLSEKSVRGLLDIIPVHASLARINTTHLLSEELPQQSSKQPGKGPHAIKQSVKNAPPTGGDVSTDLRNLISQALKERVLARAQESLMQSSVVHLDDLQYIDVSDKDLAALAPAVAKSTSLTALTLKCGTNVSTAGITQLLGSQRDRFCNSRLTRLNLVMTPRTPISLSDRKFLRKLVTNRALLHALNAIQTDWSHCNIDLSDQAIHDDDVLQMCSAISTRPQWATLELDLSNNPITNRGALTLHELIADTGSILRIDLKGSSVTGSVRSLIGEQLRIRATGHGIRLLASSFHPPLVRRSVSIDFLQGQELGDSDGINIAEHIGKGDKVEAINLSRNFGLTDVAGNKFLESLKSKRATIHTLNLHATCISSNVMSMIQKQLNRNALRLALTELEANTSTRTSITYLRNRGLSDNDMTKIARSMVLNKTILEVDFSGNFGITDAGLRSLEAALTSKEYEGSIRGLSFKGTNASQKGVESIEAILRRSTRKGSGTVTDGSGEVDSSKEQAASTSASGVSSSTKGESHWSKVMGDIDNVKRQILDMVADLELAKDGVSSFAALAIPTLPPLRLDPSLESRIKSWLSDDVDSPQNEAPKKKDAIMQLKSVGVRLKFSHTDVNLTKDGLASALEIPAHSARVYANRYDPHVFDLRLYDVALNPNVSPSSAYETCDEVAARLFTLCQDAKSLFCRQYNRGSEIFCHYPWALTDIHEAQDASAVSDVACGPDLPHCIPQILSAGKTAWESRVQRVFSEACHGLSQTLSDKIFTRPDIKRVCEQFAAQVLMQLEKAAMHSMSLQRYASPEVENTKFSLEYQQRNDVCQQFIGFARWITGGGEGIIPLADPDIESALMKQWSYVQMFLENIKRDDDSLGSETVSKNIYHQDAHTFESFLKSQQNEALRTVDALKKRWKNSFSQVNGDALKLGAEKQRREEDIKIAVLQIRERRQKIGAEIERINCMRNQDFVQIQHFLKSYSENSKRILSLTKQDDALAMAECNIENDRVIFDIDKQINALQGVLQDWKQGSNLAAELEGSIQSVSSEIQRLIEFEHERMDQNLRDLAIKLFKDNFYPVHVLSLLEIERLKYSIAVDRTEADRTRSWSDIYQPVGKLRKPRNASHSWTNSATQPQSLLAPSPFLHGSNSNTNHSWGPSYERQRSALAFLTQLVLDIPFHTIQDDMEHFRGALQKDIASALDCREECVEVHSVVPGSVIATIGLLPDRHPIYGDRSPLDLQSLLIRQSVDGASLLRSGKYTRLIKEVNQIPDSIADSSIQDQERRVASICDVCDHIAKQSGPLWTCFKQAQSAVTICAGSDTELVLFRDPETDQYISIPNNLLIKSAISYEEFIDMGMGHNRDVHPPETFKFDSDFMRRYLLVTEKRMNAACAASKQFALEYKEVGSVSKRAMDLVKRLKNKEFQLNTTSVEAEKEFKRRFEKYSEAVAKLELVKEEIAQAERRLKEAAEDVVKAQLVLSQRKLDWQQSEDGLYHIKCLECQEITEMVEPHTVGRIAKSKSLYQSAFQGLYFAYWKRGVRQCQLENVNARLYPAQLFEKDQDRAQSVAQSEKEAAKSNLEHFQQQLAEAMASATRQTHILNAYRHVSGLAAPEDEGNTSHWLVLRSHFTYLTNVQLTVGAVFKKFALDRHKKAKFLADVNQGLINFLVGQSSDKELLQEAQKRLHILDVLPSVTGNTLLRFSFLRDKSNVDAKFDEMLENLRQELMPTRPSALPVELRTGVGPTGTSPVHKIQIHDPLGCGQFGEVREADYGGKHAVVKAINFKGAQSHVARVRAEHLASELAAQVSALCLASHPNILRVLGLCFEDVETGPPFCALIQEYANDNLFDFIARHNAPRDDVVQLTSGELSTIFEALDVHKIGRITQTAFVEGVAKFPWIAEKLKVPKKVRSKDTIQYVWNYGTQDGSILDPPAEYHHPFGRLDRRGVGSFNFDELVLYYGPRELPAGRIAWPHRVAIVVALAHGMHYLIEHGLIHGNLKSANVALVDGVGENIVPTGTWTMEKIAVMDFGMPHLRKGFALMPPFQMTTPAWLSPERLLEPTFVTPQGDVWSFGVIMWEILTGEVPWPGKTLQNLCDLARAGTLQLPVLKKHHDSAPQGYIDVMRKCMDPVPAKRPTFYAVCDMIQKCKAGWSEEYLPG